MTVHCRKKNGWSCQSTAFLFIYILKAGIIKIFQGIAVLICSSNIFQGNISQLSSKPIVTILNNLDLVPDQWQLAVRNNGGG